MNVLLAEANVPYPQLKEMDEANPEFSRTDVAMVVGANDVVNPDARNNQGSPIYGMPILNVDDAQTVVVLKRSMNPGFAGIENPLFYNPKTVMLFGDAKDVDRPAHRRRQAALMRSRGRACSLTRRGPARELSRDVLSGSCPARSGLAIFGCRRRAGVHPCAVSSRRRDVRRPGRRARAPRERDRVHGEPRTELRPRGRCTLPGGVEPLLEPSRPALIVEEARRIEQLELRRLARRASRRRRARRTRSRGRCRGPE